MKNGNVSVMSSNLEYSRCAHDRAPAISFRLALFLSLFAALALGVTNPWTPEIKALQEDIGFTVTERLLTRKPEGVTGYVVKTGDGKPESSMVSGDLYFFPAHFWRVMATI